MTTPKLVRDRIPDLIAFQGRHAVTRVATAGEMPGLLRDKLREEVDEYLESGDVAELVDVLEVVYALAAAAWVTAHELDDLRQVKALERGRFVERVVLVEIPEGITR